MSIKKHPSILVGALVLLNKTVDPLEWRLVFRRQLRCLSVILRLETKKAQYYEN